MKNDHLIELVEGWIDAQASDKGDEALDNNFFGAVKGLSAEQIEKIEESVERTYMDVMTDPKGGYAIARCYYHLAARAHGIQSRNLAAGIIHRALEIVEQSKEHHRGSDTSKELNELNKVEAKLALLGFNYAEEFVALDEHTRAVRHLILPAYKSTSQETDENKQTLSEKAEVLWQKIICDQVLVGNYTKAGNLMDFAVHHTPKNSSMHIWASNELNAVCGAILPQTAMATKVLLGTSKNPVAKIEPPQPGSFGVKVG